MIRVTILTKPDCGHCEEAKRILERLAREFPLERSDLDIGSTQGQELAIKGGLLFPPGIVINDRPFGYGRPSEGKLRRKFEQLARAAGSPASPPILRPGS